MVASGGYEGLLRRLIVAYKDNGVLSNRDVLAPLLASSLIVAHDLLGARRSTPSEVSAVPSASSGAHLWDRSGRPLLLVPAPYLGKHAWGAALGAALMLGALGAHVAKLGFSGANGQLAVMATVALVCCLYVVWARRGELPFIGG